MARGNLNKLVEIELLKNLHSFENIISDVAGIRSPQATCLVHGDLYSRHLLVDENNQLCGVIDWGDVHLGSPAIDLAIAHSFLPPSAHDIFRRAYGSLEEDTWQWARFRALYHSTAIAVYSHEVSDETLELESITALQYLS